MDSSQAEGELVEGPETAERTPQGSKDARKDLSQGKSKVDQRGM